jgi:hypothetical protein
MTDILTGKEIRTRHTKRDDWGNDASYKPRREDPGEISPADTLILCVCHPRLRR